jgi:hypothetical protein
VNNQLVRIILGVPFVYPAVMPAHIVGGLATFGTYMGIKAVFATGMLATLCCPELRSADFRPRLKKYLYRGAVYAGGITLLSSYAETSWAIAVAQQVGLAPTGPFVTSCAGYCSAASRCSWRTTWHE